MNRILVGLMGAAVAIAPQAGAAGDRAQSPRPAAAPLMTPARKVAIDAELHRLRHRGDFPGVTFAYRFDDGEHGASAVGYSDIETRTPMSPDAPMLSGSIGKTYVAAVVLQLAEEGRLRLDDRISTWLGGEPWFATLPNGPDITVRMLLNHTSGLPSHVNTARFAQAVRADPDRFWTPEERLFYILGKDPLFAAGTRYAYSESGYILLGMLVERVAGQSYHVELSRRFLVPLRLDSTRPSNTRLIPGLTTGYTRKDNPWRIPEKVSVAGRNALNPQIEWTGGGLVSTSSDLAKWAQALYAGEALSAQTRKVMLEAVETGDQIGDGQPMRFGLGVMIRNGRLGPSYGHAGDFPGYRSFMFYYPRYRLAVALQINKDSFDVDGPAYLAHLDRLAEIVGGAR